MTFHIIVHDKWPQTRSGFRTFHARKMWTLKSTNFHNFPVSMNYVNSRTVMRISDVRTLSATGEVAFVPAVPDERVSNVAVMDWICARRLLSIWGTWLDGACVPDDEVSGICWASCCCNSCSCSRLSVGSNVYTQQRYIHSCQDKKWKSK